MLCAAPGRLLICFGLLFRDHPELFRFFPAFLRGSLGDSCNVGLAGLVFAQQQVILDARKHFFSGIYAFGV